MQWTASIEESACFQWLAQCQPRLAFPIDAPEETPYLAFEYGWKVVNRLYNELKVPKQTDPQNGKKRKANAKESLLYLMKHFGVTDRIVDENRGRIDNLCDCVLEKRDSGRRWEKRGYVTFDDPVEEGPKHAQQDGKPPEASKATTIALRDALKTNDSANVASALADWLLSVRNARVHAMVCSCSDGRRTPARIGDYHSDYEIKETAAQILLATGKILLSAKTRMRREEVEALVRSRMKQIMKEIRERVTKW
ncbi:hypothetical protein ACVIIW_005566 [Bradyrhizobium sp. USDA 4449]